jgi:hypothetical protein
MLRYLPIWLTVALAVGFTYWLRMDWIQSAPVAQQCLAGLHSAGCMARAAAVAAFLSGGVTVMAAVAAVLALFWKHPFSAWLATLAGGVALVLYSPEAGAAALLIGTLRLVRLQIGARARPGDQHRGGQQHVAQRP